METGATALPSGLSVDELLDWRPDLGVVTVCVGIDPANRSEGWLTELRQQLKAAVEGGDDGHDRGRALTATAQRVLDRFDEELPSGRCQIGFCEATDGRRARDIWTAAQMDGFRTSASYGDRPRLTPLLKLLDEGAAVGVVAVSAERIHLYEWKLGALELIHDWEAEMYSLDWRERKAGKPSNISRTQGAASSGRDQYDQRLEHNRLRFLEETGRLTADEARSRSWRRLIGFGDPEHVREFDKGAEKTTEVELAEAVDVIPEERGKLLERVNAAVAAANQRRELELIERAVDGARTPGGHGALGVTDVQRCLNEGRVEHLIFDADTQDPELADVEDEVVERALRTSAKMTPVEDAAAERIREHGGVAAVLRY
ncbi:MAG TPA: VLRF1 family aeRF1-type release factor [Solirubrobacterales bacterium]